MLDGPVRVIDGDTLEISGERVRLFGIDAPEHDQRCTDAAGRPWACGTRATEALRDLTRGRAVRCSGEEQDRYGRLVARCTVAGRDLGAAMVHDGMAFAYRRYSRDYVGAEEQAKAAGRGIWAGAAENPAAVRAGARPVQAAPGGCAIKGNISSRGRIYHLPDDRSYAKTRINTATGERWFCTEAAARAAGWRHAGD